MHPRALVYHPARTDFNCLPLYHEVIEVYEKAERLPLSTLFENDPTPKSESEISGARNIAGGVWVESVLAKKIARLRDDLTEDSDEARAYAQEFSFTLNDIKDYRVAGENIFHIQPAIINLFRHSDLGDAQIDRVKLPFEHFYLHFGEFSKIALGAHHVLDGAYITNVSFTPGTRSADTPEMLFVRLVTRSTNTNYETRRDPIRYLMADLSAMVHLGFDETKSLDEAIQTGIAEMPDGEDYKCIPEFRVIFPPSALRESLNLVANALLFLSSEHVDVTHRYPATAPANLVKKETAGDGENQRERAASKLWNLGFKKVHFVGDAIERETAEAHARGDLQEAHWRRGHWRNQAHGPSNSLRKAIWIRPTIVRPDLGEPHAKRIYSVPD